MGILKAALCYKFGYDTRQDEDKFEVFRKRANYNANIEEISKGGFNTVIKATWLDGRRRKYRNPERESNSIVALRLFEVDSLVNITFPGLMGGGKLKRTYETNILK
ncbi:hypothetical protein C2G38_2175557 [Gigaspora rosea]|uniref:Uncharacterized protein n=1 Tax=Gigaspora rosea TaxID=44941 RepID=A0A397VPJ1_9GLOM|nr:hypothetical protein C2G38_2175557 [Gigaspora rosea]